jgi:hypothetical protein
MATISSPDKMVRPATHSFSPSVESAMAGKTERGTTEVFSSVQLRAPDGSFWKLRVDNTGALSTTKVIRT